MAKDTHHFGASAGGTKIWIMIFLMLGGGIFIATKLGPVYQTKWEMEDRMDELIRRYHTLGEDGVFDTLQVYVDRKELGFNVYDNCTFEGEEGQRGRMECNYEVKLGLPKYEIIKLKAIATVPKIPSISN